MTNHSSTPEHWRHIEQAFSSARELEGEQRTAFLAQLERDAPDVHVEVKSLLDVHSRAGSRLEDSALVSIAGEGGPTEASRA